MSYLGFDPLESVNRIFLGSIEFRWGPNKKEPEIIAQKVRAIRSLVDDMEPVMAVGREFLIEDIQDRFDREVDLNGVPWPKRSPLYRKWLKKKGYGNRKILQKDYHLIEAVTDRNSYKVTSKTLSIDTSNWPIYWHAHNVGSVVGKGRQLPKREFLGMSEGVAFSLAEAFDDYIENFLQIIWPTKHGIPMERGAFGRISRTIHATDVTRSEASRTSAYRNTNL